MAVAFDTSLSLGATLGTSVSASITVGTGSDRAGVAGPGWASSGVSVSTITRGAAGFTVLASSKATNASGFGGIGGCAELWHLVNPASGSATDTCTWDGSVEGGCGVAYFTGVDQTTPLTVGTPATGNSTTPASTASGGGAGDFAVGCMAAETFGGVGDLSTSDTEAWENFNDSFNGTVNGGAYATSVQAINWTLTGTSQWAATSARVNQVAAGSASAAAALLILNPNLRGSLGGLRTSIQ